MHINCKEGAQICIRVNKITTQWWPNITIKESKQIILYIYFSFSCYYVHIMLLIWQKKMKLFLMVVSVLFKIKFGHAQIIVPKIGMPISKTAWSTSEHSQATRD